MCDNSNILFDKLYFFKTILDLMYKKRCSCLVVIFHVTGMLSRDSIRQETKVSISSSGTKIIKNKSQKDSNSCKASSH